MRKSWQYKHCQVWRKFHFLYFSYTNSVSFDLFNILIVVNYLYDFTVSGHWNTSPDNHLLLGHDLFILLSSEQHKKCAQVCVCVFHATRN